MKIKKNNIITGLDIGSSKTSAVAANVDRDNVISILGAVWQPSKGISTGTITNLKDAVSSVASVLDKLGNKISADPGDIYVNMSGEGVKGIKSRGMIALSIRGREVTRLDMTRCVSVAGTIHLPLDREILHRIVHNFSVDDRPPVKDPLGLYASRLNCEVYVVTCDINEMQNIYKCVNNAGYSVKEIVFTGVAEGATLLDKDVRDKGAAIIDIGDSTTIISIFYNGALYDLEVITLGAKDTKGDFKQDEKFGSLVSSIDVRMKDFIKGGGSVSSVTLTGGMCITENLAEYLEERLAYPVKMGVAKGVMCDISGADGVRLSTAIGLVKYASEKRDRTLFEPKNIAKKVSERVVDIFNNYF